ncbi:MAG: serine hydrolase [Myxococcota bacterium]
MQTLAEQLELPDSSEPDIDRCVNKGVADKVYSAGACTASIGDRIFHRSAHGSPVHPPPLRRIDTSALFDLASLTKPLATGLAALYLSSRSQLDLGASITRTLPEFKHHKPFEDITVDMLLDHTSGFPATKDFWRTLREQDLRTHPNDRVLGTQKSRPRIMELLLETPLEYRPGTKTVYSDIGFMVLGWIIEHITGKPLDVWLEREIYRPLGIHNELFFVRLDDARARQRLRRRTFIATEECPWREKVLQGEVHDPMAWALGGVAGHAGLFGTADAVWALARKLLQCYNGEDRFFLSGGVRRFWTRSRRTPGTTRTLAWDTPTANLSMSGKRFSLSSVGHLGFTGCSLWIDLSTQVIGVVLTNSAHPTPDGKQEAMQKFRPRVYDLIAKYGESMPPDPGKPQGSQAFYSGPGVGISVPLHNPLRGPGKPGS